MAHTLETYKKTLSDFIHMRVRSADRLLWGAFHYSWGILDYRNMVAALGELDSKTKALNKGDIQSFQDFSKALANAYTTQFDSYIYHDGIGTYKEHTRHTLLATLKYTAKFKEYFRFSTQEIETLNQSAATLLDREDSTRVDVIKAFTQLTFTGKVATKLTGFQETLSKITQELTETQNNIKTIEAPFREQLTLPEAILKDIEQHEILHSQSKTLEKIAIKTPAKYIHTGACGYEGGYKHCGAEPAEECNGREHRILAYDLVPDKEEREIATNEAIALLKKLKRKYPQIENFKTITEFKVSTQSQITNIKANMAVAIRDLRNEKEQLETAQSRFSSKIKTLENARKRPYNIGQDYDGSGIANLREAFQEEITTPPDYGSDDDNAPPHYSQENSELPHRNDDAAKFSIDDLRDDARSIISKMTWMTALFYKKSTALWKLERRLNATTNLAEANNILNTLLVIAATPRGHTTPINDTQNAQDNSAPPSYKAQWALQQTGNDTRNATSNYQSRDFTSAFNDIPNTHSGREALSIFRRNNRHPNQSVSPVPALDHGRLTN